MNLAEPDPRSDAELVAAAGAGDLAAFEVLYLRHRDWTVALAHRFAGDRELALDVLQETFAYLLRRLPGLRLTARLTTFLYPVVKHNAQEARRKRRLGAPREDDASSVPASPDHAPLRAAVDALPEPQREVLLMRFASGMTMGEIALALNVPVGTVKSRLHHALARLGTEVGAE
jgi:RNA polymerase sigma-70 factor, ECF subfamily